MSDQLDIIAVLLGQWSQGMGGGSAAFRVCLAFLLSVVIGWERASKRHSAGLRTFIVITLATTMAGMTDAYLQVFAGAGGYGITAASVIGAAIISGYSILFNARNQIKGLTTAAALWTCAIIGGSIGVGQYTAALAVFAALYICLSTLPKVEKYLRDKSNHFEVHLELKNREALVDFASTIRQLGMRIDDIEMNPAYVDTGIYVYSVMFTIDSEELKKYKSHKEIIDALQTLSYIEHIEEMK